MKLNEDMHVHSRFSDGKHTLEENARQAQERGLSRLGCVDHVRRDTPWVNDFVAEVRRVNAMSSVELFAGVEAKILDEAGTLDLPESLDGIDFIYAADHQYPLGDHCRPPEVVRTKLRSGELSAAEVVERLVRTTQRVLCRYDNVVIAHLFSVLPKLRLDEHAVRDALLRELARTAAERGALIEVDERWRCPSARVLKHFIAEGVRVVASSDSHKRDDIGCYDYVRDVAQALEGAA